MTKYLLVLWMCSMTNGQCPSSTLSGYEFSNHYDCTNAGYAFSQKTFRALEEVEGFDRNYIEENKIVVKFECRPIEFIIPKPKPKTPA
tara:strand:+ start:420 stop:683 length:264 start_codon:yes stop_codon:yes gene_type:complete